MPRFWRTLRTGAGVVTEGKPPENAREKTSNQSGDDEMQHQPGRLLEGLDEQSGWNIGHDHGRDDPAEDETKDWREDNVGIARDMEEIKVAVDESLRPNDPETDGSKRKHDRIMDSHAEADCHEIKRDHAGVWNDLQFRERNNHDNAAENGIEDAVQTELFRGNRELTVDRKNEKRVEASSPDELRDIRDIHEEKSLE